MKKYFLFGQQACSMVNNAQDGENAATTAAFIKADIYEVFQWDEQSSPEHLLSISQDWNDWCVISEELFDLL